MDSLKQSAVYGDKWSVGRYIAAANSELGFIVYGKRKGAYWVVYTFRPPVKSLFMA